MSEAQDFYSPAQETVLALLPYFTAPPSIIGSFLILYAIWFDRKELLKQVFHRLMVGISSLDLLTSLNMVVLGAWVVPSDWNYGRSGRGTIGTCEASAFILTFVLGTMNYTAFLALYFVLLINFEVKEGRIARYMEPIAHAFGILFPLMAGIGGLVDDLFNPLFELPGWCWFAENPPLCRAEEDCERGYPSGAEVFRDSYSLAMVVALGWIVVCMAAIVFKVQRQERRLQQYSVTGRPASYSRTKETAQQAILYITVFFVTFTPAVIVMVITERSGPTKHKKLVFAFALLTKLFTPLQGCFNSFIYFRKRFSKLIKPGESLAFVAKLPFGIGNWIVERNSSSPTSSDSRQRRRWLLSRKRPQRTDVDISEAEPATTLQGDVNAEDEAVGELQADEPTENGASETPPTESPSPESPLPPAAD